MAREKESVRNVSRLIPEGGVQFDLPQGKALTRIHLDLTPDGISLATVGAATAALSPGNRQRVSLQRSKDGLVLSLVGAATSASPR